MWVESVILRFSNIEDYWIHSLVKLHCLDVNLIIYEHF